MVLLTWELCGFFFSSLVNIFVEWLVQIVLLSSRQ